ncbi:MAG TPA: TonB-dependent receptor [Terriglobales bacterium]|nr:TonB-dependent receptor [Terriglobales bacterium]
MIRRVGLAVLLMSLAVSAHAGKLGTISGHVKNASGVPQMGAMVEIISAGKVLPEATVFTDVRGFYAVMDLLPGKYEVKASAPMFLPSLRENIPVHGGAGMVVNMTLNTLADAIKLLPARRSGEDDDDWKWTLRSMANRPVLRVQNGGPVVVSNQAGQSESLKASLGFMAGSQAESFGGPSEMSTDFSLEHSLFGSGRLAFQGDVGYGPGAGATILHAAYDHALADGSRPQLALTMRRFASSPLTVARDGALEALNASFADTTTLLEVLDLHAGMEFQTVQYMGRVNAYRPFGSVDLHLSPHTVVEYQYATAEPNSRRSKGYDSAPADLTEGGLRMSMVDFNPVLEKARHQEISVSHKLDKTSLQLAAFSDSIRNAALMGVGDVDPNSPNLLPDIYSGTFTYNGGDLNTNGIRLVLQRKLNKDLTATVNYSYGGVLTMLPTDSGGSIQNLHTVRRHGVAAKLSGDAPFAKTHWIASYKWTSGGALTPVDLFNVSAGQADPYLNLFLRQPLPAGGFMPFKMEVLVDIRNLLAQGYMPVAASDGRTVYLVQSPRAVRGGLAFVF